MKLLTYFYFITDHDFNDNVLRAFFCGIIEHQPKGCHIISSKITSYYTKLNHFICYTLFPLVSLLSFHFFNLIIF